MYRLKVDPYWFADIASGSKTIEGRLASRFFTGPAESPRLRGDAPRRIRVVCNNEHVGTDAEEFVDMRVVRYTHYPTLQKYLDECFDDAMPEYQKEKLFAVRVSMAMLEYLKFWSREQIAAANGIAAVRFVRESSVARLGKELWAETPTDADAPAEGVDAPGISPGSRVGDINRTLRNSNHTARITHAGPPLQVEINGANAWEYPVRVQGKGDEAVEPLLAYLRESEYESALTFRPNALMCWRMRDDGVLVYQQDFPMYH